MENQKNIYIVGIGHAGGKILNVLSKFPMASEYNLVAIDTDKRSLDNLHVENKFLISVKQNYDNGCGGDIELGARLFSRDRKKIKALIEDARLIIVVGGLGGGTGTGGFPFFARYASKTLNVPIIFILTMPFMMEGSLRDINAQRGLRELQRDASVIIPIANDLLYYSDNMNSDLNFKSACLRAEIEYAHAVMGIAEIINCDCFLSIDFADFNNIFQNQKCECTIGVGQIEKEQSLASPIGVVDDMLKSPLLGTINKIKEADLLFTTIIGGKDLKMNEVKNIFNIISSYSKNKELYTGVNTDNKYDGFIQLTVLTIKFAHSKKRPKKKEKSGNEDEIEQPTLGLNSNEKGIFEKYKEVLYKGNDLDIPTFMREDIYIDKGNSLDENS